MSIEKRIIEELDAIAKVAIRAEDLPRWKNAKDLIEKRLEPGRMKKAAQDALLQLRRYDGSDFQFKVTEPPIDVDVIVYFQLGDMTPQIPAYVNARHEYSGKWKYDLTFAVKLVDAWHTTRIYNVESKWLTMI